MISDILKKAIEEMGKEILEQLKIKSGESVVNILDKVKDDIKSKIDNISVDDILSGIKTAWNLKEIKTEELSLEKCISLIKSEFNPKLYSSACIIKKDISDIKKYKFKIHICFLDKNDEPILNGNALHWIIHTNKLDNNLLNQFGSKDNNKDMIILK